MQNYRGTTLGTWEPLHGNYAAILHLTTAPKGTQGHPSLNATKTAIRHRILYVGQDHHTTHRAPRRKQQQPPLLSQQMRKREKRLVFSPHGGGRESALAICLFFWWWV